MKITLLAAVAAFTLTSTGAFAAGSEDYPTPVTRPIMSSTPEGADVGSNGRPFSLNGRVAISNGGVMLNNSSEAEADSTASMPDRSSDRPLYAVNARVGNHG